MNRILIYMIIAIIVYPLCFSKNNDNDSSFKLNEYSEISEITAKPYREVLQLNNEILIKMATKDDITQINKNIGEDLNDFKLTFWCIFGVIQFVLGLIYGLFIKNIKDDIKDMCTDIKSLIDRISKIEGFLKSKKAT